jgi:hypothetical protein
MDEKPNVTDIIISPEVDPPSLVKIDSQRNDAHLSQIVSQNQSVKKKNRTLQFFKFLLYSLKMEVKNNEFLVLVKTTSVTESILWFLSIVLYFDSGSKYFIVWLQIIHLIRGVIGLYILDKVPMSYDLIENMNVDVKSLETKVYNDIVRDVINEKALPKFKEIKLSLLSYFLLTIINFFIDIIGFLYSLAHLGETKNGDVYYLCFFTFSVAYIGKYLFI